ncbi:MAG: phenylacetate--CoA ligase family protein [Christensenellaceae bacterium]|jgi:phenylacetate-CoA ligase
MWNMTAETMPRDQLRELQTRRLVKLVYKVYQNVPFYREKMQKAGISPEDIRDIGDIKHLPFTTKDDLRDAYPYKMFAAPLSDIVRIHASSGTTGKPTVVGYTQNDISMWAECAARSLAMAGGSKKSIVQVSYGYGLFTGGLGMHYGAEKMGASVIPTSGGNTSRQIMVMKDFGSTILCCTPSYALYLAETMREMGISPAEMSLKAGIMGAEPWTEEMRREIETGLNIKVHDIYGLSEIAGPGVSCECEVQQGMHIQEDMFYPEIIEPETLEVLDYGEKGEIVFTTLNKEGIPLIRYRTRDITMLNDKKCECGRTFVRMNRLLGRSDDMLIIRGVNVFPSQIESVLVKYEGIAPYYMIIVSREDNIDVLEIQVEFSTELFSDEVRHMEELQHKIVSELQSVLNINAKLTFVEPKSLPRSEGKSQHVIDKRNL